MRSPWNYDRMSLFKLFLLFLSTSAANFLEQQQTTLLKAPTQKSRSSYIQTSTRVDRLYFSGETCISSRKEPIITLQTSCPCFIQYTLHSPQTVTWDVFITPLTAFLRWRRSQYAGDPLVVLEDFSTRNKTILEFGFLESPDLNAMIEGDFVIAVRTNTDRRTCFSNEPPPSGSSIVFEAIPRACPIHLPPNETSPRIVGGTVVTKGFGWMAVIWLTAVADPIAVCGGVHIMPGYVLTAAHCMIQQAPAAYRVRVGTLRADQGEFVRIRRVFTHPRYRTLASNEAVYDVAVLELVNMPETGVLKLNKANDIPSTGEWVSTAGFGYIAEDWSVLPSPNRLRRVDVKVIGKEECEGAYKDVNQDLHICAGQMEGGCDSCLSDSGGPLRAVVNGSEVLVGVVSYGNGCARRDTPGVYTRISHIAQWVEETVESALMTRRGPHVWILAVGLSGGVVAVVVVAVVVVLVVKRRRKRNAPRVVRQGSSVPSETGVSE